MVGSTNYGASAGGSVSDLSRYDLVLAVIPLAFLVGLFVSGLFPVSLRGGMAMASAVGALAVADALFLNPPAPRSGSSS